MKISTKPSSREDGRKQLVLIVKADLIRQLKSAAVDQDKNTYEIAEEAFEAYLSGLAKPEK